MVRIQVPALQFLKADQTRCVAPDGLDVQRCSVVPGVNPVAFVKRTSDVEGHYPDQGCVHLRILPESLFTTRLPRRILHVTDPRRLTSLGWRVELLLLSQSSGTVGDADYYPPSFARLMVG